VINHLIVKVLPLVPRRIIRRFAGRYIAGERIIDAIELCRKLNEQGMMTTLDVLGEHVSNREQARKAVGEAIKVLHAIDEHKLDSNLSLKLTQTGLKLDFDFCLDNVLEILETAERFGQFVRFDMEDSTCTEDTFKMFEKVRKFYPKCGVVVQAYLRRTYEDVKRLCERNTNIRVCKGIYIEPEEIAFKKKQEIIENFLRILRYIFEKKCYAAIATHNDKVIEGAKKLIQEFGKGKEEYEFQMLLGVRENLRDKLLREGHRLRVYVPFGEEWYQYSMRRFRENPQVAGYVMRAVFNGR